MVELAIVTGIPVHAWALEDDATIVTALQVLQEVHDRGTR